MPMPTDEAVAAAAAIMAEVESIAHIAKGKLRDLRPLLKDIHDNGDAGLLLTRMLASEADAIGTKFEADVWGLHALMTEHAKVLGIDLPSIESGGGR